MSRPPDPDAWLDAFHRDDLAHPDLQALDDAVDRLTNASPPAAYLRRWSPRRVVLGAAILLLAAAVLLAVREPRLPAALPAQAPERAPEVTALASEVSPVRQTLPAAAAPQSPVLPSVSRTAPVETVAAAEVPTAPAARPGPGLLPGEGARFTVSSGVATLEGGLLTYVHDASHEPGVRVVTFLSLPVSLQPVGTVFTASVRPHIGAVRVTDGTVRVEAGDGTLLAELGPGQEVVAVPDLDTPSAVRLVHTTGLPLDTLSAQLPSDCVCQPRDVVAAVASIRLASRSLPATLLEVP